MTETRAETVLRTIRRWPGRTADQLARIMGVSRRVIHGVLTGLMRSGQVRRDGLVGSKFAEWHAVEKATSELQTVFPTTVPPSIGNGQ